MSPPSLLIYLFVYIKYVIAGSRSTVFSSSYLVLNTCQFFFLDQVVPISSVVLYLGIEEHKESQLNVEGRSTEETIRRLELQFFSKCGWNTASIVREHADNELESSPDNRNAG